MNLKDIQLSDYGSRSSTPSPVSRMMTEFSSGFRDGVDINLGVGYVNEQTIPAIRIGRALERVIRNPRKFRQAFNYGGAAGSTNLVSAIRKYLVRNGYVTRKVLDRNRIIIGASGVTSLLEAVGRVIRPGIVITTDPMYYIFCEYLERQGFELVTVPEDDDGMQVDKLRKLLAGMGSRRRHISFFYVTTVGNPTCSILSNKRRHELVRTAEGLSRMTGRRIPVILDRAYEDLVHDPSVGQLRSALSHDRMGIVYELGTLSKVLAPALRIGYMAGRDSAFLRAMIQKTSDTSFSASLFCQDIAEYMLDHHMAGQISAVNRGYRHKARIVKAWIRKYLGQEVEWCRGGKAGFYYYLSFRSVETHEESPFFRYLSRTTGRHGIDGPAHRPLPKVIYLPGIYCVHAGGRSAADAKRQLRISYGFEELERIHNAFRIMNKAIDFAQKKS